jgi:tRNA(fMet)-specific endonuclease VapC
MALRYLLDTNICIHIRQRRPPEVLARFARMEAGEAALSVITYGELAFGVVKSEQPRESRRQLMELISIVPVLPLPQEAGDAYGAIRADLKRRGEMIGHNDLWIAAHAKAAGLVLVTANEREFARVADLSVENWAR